MKPKELLEQLKELQEKYSNWSAYDLRNQGYRSAIESSIELVENFCLNNVVDNYSLKVGDKIKFPSGLNAEVIETKVKVKDEFGGIYYISDIEVGNINQSE